MMGEESAFMSAVSKMTTLRLFEIVVVTIIRNGGHMGSSDMFDVVWTRFSSDKGVSRGCSAFAPVCI